MMKQNKTTLIIAVLLLAGITIGLASLVRPKLVPAEGQTASFSAERAMKHVFAISQKPHPPGSGEIERVRVYIISQLEALGLSPDIQKTTSVIPQSSSVVASSIMNIIVKINGTNSTKAILLDAHYDTRAMTPGASDNSSAAIRKSLKNCLSANELFGPMSVIFWINCI